MDMTNQNILGIAYAILNLSNVLRSLKLRKLVQLARDKTIYSTGRYTKK